MMKNNTFTGGMLVSILFFFYACQAKTEAISIHKEEIKPEIQAIENQLAMAYNNINAESLSYYADNAISYFAEQEPVIGRDAILQHLRNEIIDFPQGAHLSFETVESYISDNGALVLEIGAHQLADSTGMVFQKGHNVSFFAKRDGKYVCTRDIANSVYIEPLKDSLK